MRPIPSDDGVERYFLDSYIPSYTPTLSALIESRKPGERTSGKPSILLVAQPKSLQDADPEISFIQRLSTKVTSLFSKWAIPGKAFDASSQLYRGEQLTLLDLVRSRLPIAEFAFLSACHTEGTPLYCGFRSVVGTMWAMADADGQDVVEEFHKSILSSEELNRVCHITRDLHWRFKTL
jgi:CHAT domain-containing protein